ncbi:AP-3 complex subunit beta-2 [Trichinella papuae]|uniref:AP-3 complex subunit beta n=1 Tax=Trichinella papuae TaxID=268474 RepID=A0A0V1N2W3_9BILA|nr:AP-3 complex subunit beta-2 [Trichinella papuae]
MFNDQKETQRMPYSTELGSPEIEIAGDAATSSFFADTRSRHADLKEMLDSGKDSSKVEAMKRIISLIAKGKDASDLFAAVVKNVASKNPEVKKLVYVYLTRYAEEQQDLALLSISTFQRALKDPNQLIRASALRVLSSIRVPIIVPIMMLVIKESVRDMSAYVRKVAAHAIPKLYLLDPEQKDQLIEIISRLLADKATLVIGSAVYAFEEVCPERLDLIHKHYRKLCTALVDVDEWGQVLIINMLTRYARTQFTDPAILEKSSSDCGNELSDESDSDISFAKKPTELDPDLRMLLKNSKSLLQSRNSAVVLAVAQLYYHLAPPSEVNIIARALVRLLRSHREVQSVILTNIATISAKKTMMFEPFLRSFFVRSSDSANVKALKLEILTNLATSSNISIILREFQTYVTTLDKEFAACAIDAIGRCACNITEVRDSCLVGLVALMSNSNGRRSVAGEINKRGCGILFSELVVAQSVVVIKQLLQREKMRHCEIILSMAKLIDTVRVPIARASILWLIGEYCQLMPRVGPDVLRKVAKTFIHEEEIVKLQALNLAVKLYLTNEEKTRLLVEYVFNMARFDQNYDMRDRVRLLRHMLFPNKPTKLTKLAEKIFFAEKPVPSSSSTFVDREQFQLGTLSHLLNQRCSGYNPLPPFAETAPDGSVRDVDEPVLPSQELNRLERLRRTSDKSEFFKVDICKNEDSEDSDDEDEDDSSDDDDDDDDYDEDNEDEEDESTSDGERFSDSDDELSAADEQHKTVVKIPARAGGGSKLTSSSDISKKKSTNMAAAKSDLLIDIDDFSGSGKSTPPVMSTVPVVCSTTAAVFKAPKQHGNPGLNQQYYITVGASFISEQSREVLNKVAGHGVSVSYRFTRMPNLFSSTMCTVELSLHNQGTTTIEKIDSTSSKVIIKGLKEVGNLVAGEKTIFNIGVDAKDSTHPVSFDMQIDHFPPTTVTFIVPVGEQLQPIKLNMDEFQRLQQALGGLNENRALIDFKSNCVEEVSDCILRTANVNRIYLSERNQLYFAAQTLSSKSPLLIELQLPAVKHETGTLAVNCENFVIGSMLFRQLKAILTSSN